MSKKLSLPSSCHLLQLLPFVSICFSDEKFQEIHAVFLGEFSLLLSISFRPSCWALQLFYPSFPFFCQSSGWLPWWKWMNLVFFFRKSKNKHKQNKKKENLGMWCRSILKPSTLINFFSITIGSPHSCGSTSLLFLNLLKNLKSKVSFFFGSKKFRKKKLTFSE